MAESDLPSSRPAASTSQLNGDHPSVELRRRRTPKPIDPVIQAKWNRIFTRLEIVTLPRRIAAAGTRSAGKPCATCASMKLTENKFLIHDFAKHRRIDRSKETSSDEPAQDVLGPEGLEFGPKEFKLGALKDIYSRKDACALCRLIVNSQLDVFLRETPGNTEEKFSKLDITCFISWQIDGRILLRERDGTIKGSRACTRRLRLRWENEEWRDLYMVLMEKKNTTQNLFLARSLENFRTDAALVQRWLRFCDDSHGDMCSPLTPETLVSKPFLGVIDVRTMCLTRLPKDARYVALSYTWGKTQWRFQTKRDNIKYLMLPGGLNEWHEALPRTIRDSIRLVTDIGERYLWVDSLCIIQDSNRSWALNSKVMNVVYGNAYFTICAADGDDAGAGLRALGPGDRSRRTQQNIAFYSRDIRLKCLQPAEHYIHESRWNTRGWTFQERLLSRRNLIFADGRMFFQCRCTARSPDIITEDESAGWSIEFSLSPSLMLQKLPHQPLLVYKQALELYMKRKLTFQKDILAAFTGIGNLVCDALGGSLVFGLPSSHFDWALLWEFQDAATRRQKESDEQFPSWSWCGWKNEQMDFQYKQQMLSGIEENLHDWLMYHTWITWYVRDGNGNLRLIWDGNSGKAASAKVESTWRGYTLPRTPNTDKYDHYGRYIKEGERHLKRDHGFSLILDECPFGVEIVQDSEAHTPNSTEKDMPFLQFYSWSAFFRIREDKRFTYKSSQNFRRYSIEDYKDDWCGTIMLDSVWVLQKELELEDPMEFVAISDAKQFAQEEYDDWANYIPMERRESTWDLYYVLLIKYERDIAYRVGLGKVYKEAFENSCKPEGKRWKEFMLG